MARDGRARWQAEQGPVTGTAAADADPAVVLRAGSPPRVALQPGAAAARCDRGASGRRCAVRCGRWWRTTTRCGCDSTQAAEGWEQAGVARPERRRRSAAAWSTCRLCRRRAASAVEAHGGGARRRASTWRCGPLLRVALFALGAGRPGGCCWSVHHLAVDGVSWRILLEDLETPTSSRRGARRCGCRPRRRRSSAGPSVWRRTRAPRSWRRELAVLARRGAASALAPLPVDWPGAKPTGDVARDGRAVSLERGETRGSAAARCPRPTGRRSTTCC